MIAYLVVIGTSFHTVLDAFNVTGFFGENAWCLVVALWLITVDCERSEPELRLGDRDGNCGAAAVDDARCLGAALRFHRRRLLHGAT